MLKSDQKNKQLLTKFSCDEINVLSLLSSMHQNLYNPGTLDYLIGRLYLVEQQCISDYIPQLWYSNSQYSLLCVKLNLPKLEEYLIQYGLSDMGNYFRIEWLFEAYSVQERQVEKMKGRIINFKRQLEIRFINIVLNPTLVKQLRAELNEEQFQQQLCELCDEKQDRSNYIIFIGKLVQFMIRISLQLKQSPIELRRNEMKQYLIKINNQIEILRSIFLKNYKYQGIALPFTNGQTGEKSLVVNVIANDFTCFNTAQRVPYRIVFETVDPQEYLEHSASMEIRQGNQSLDESVVDVEEREEQLEIKLQQIAYQKLYNDIDIQALKRLTSIEFAPKSKDVLNQVQFQIQDVQSEDQNQDLWKELWQDKAQLIKSNSKFGNYKSYSLKQYIIKGGDDLRQELIVMQLLKRLDQVFQRQQVKLYLRPYDIIITSTNSGMIEFVPNSISMDSLKKKYGFQNLNSILMELFSGNYEEAQKNFAMSLAGYSLVCYLFQVKDRHNGNILLDSMGHIVHIDFGFAFTLNPGSLNFETAPFKLTREYVEVLGGLDSYLMLYFKSLLFQGIAIVNLGLLALRQHIDEFVILIKLMMVGEYNDLACLKSFQINEFIDRCRINLNEQQLLQYVEDLVIQSSDNWRTSLYDYFQYKSNGILY